jgi:hypothetical protein
MYIHKYCNKNCKKQTLLVPNIIVFKKQLYLIVTMFTLAQIEGIKSRYPKQTANMSNNDVAVFIRRMCEYISNKIKQAQQALSDDDETEEGMELVRTKSSGPTEISLIVDEMTQEQRENFLRDFVSSEDTGSSGGRIDGVSSDP